MEPTFAAGFPAAAHVLVSTNLPAPNLPAPNLPAPSLADALVVDGSDGHHLVRVRRLQVGEVVTAADGQGQWRPYLVSSVDDRALTLTATGSSRTEPVPTPRLAVAFALTKGIKPETVVRQLTELGVDEILPVVASRSIVRLRGERAVAFVERLERVAREAAMQSRRAWLPRVAAVAPLATLAGRPGLVIAERGDLPTTDPPDPGAGGWLLVVGPEGGLAPEDLEGLGLAGLGLSLEGRGAEPVTRLSVGPHVLRAETAAVAAAAVLGARRTAEASGPGAPR